MNIDSTSEKVARRIVFLALFIAALILVYMWLNNGSPKGYILERTAFPGAQSAELASGRQKILHTTETVNAAVAALVENPIMVSELYTTDKCVKGVHTIGIAGGGRDPYAYWCTLAAHHYYLLSQEPCEVVERLASHDAFSANECRTDTLGTNVYTKERESFFGGAMAELSVHDIEAVRKLGGLPVYDLQVGCNIGGRKSEYCNMRGDIKAVNPDLFPAETKTVLIVETSNTYYQK